MQRRGQRRPPGQPGRRLRRHQRCGLQHGL
uniref:Uncharacterized protein n=1 Tax=Arundo donax TaxID=35708 RepID=A0A0A9BZA6_ARUDO